MFLNNLIARIRAIIKYRQEQFVRNLPFRMTVGRFGIRLVQFGRFLQIRYANWNKEFRLKHEFLQDYPHDICSINVSARVTEESVVTFSSPSSQQNKMIPLVRSLFNVVGITEVTLYPYKIWVKKGAVFSWEELLPDVDRVTREHLTA